MTPARREYNRKYRNSEHGKMVRKLWIAKTTKGKAYAARQEARKRKR